MAFDSNTANALADQLARMKAAHVRDGQPDQATRARWIDRAVALLVENQDALYDAVSADFGHRSKDQTAFADLVQSVNALKHAKKNLRKWMKPSKRPVEFPLGLLGARAVLHYQPKGVVGIVSPWNFPIGMIFSPLAGIFAAGNRAMVKPSEFTARTSALVAELVPKYFDAEVLSVATGDAQTGAAFTALPFDHMIFTGSTAVGRHVMRAAAENLVPVTLELGGKSPTIVGQSANMAKSARRIMHGKTLNAGQICTAPDYALVPEGKTGEFVTATRAAVAEMYPSGLKDNDDYGSIINQRHYDRLLGLIEDARQKGAEIVEINPKGENFTQQPHHKIPPHLILNATDDMAVMQEEIFGPILPVRTYRKIDDAIAMINDRPRPLALYYFGEAAEEREHVLNRTTSGGVTVNDTLFHVAQEDLPFGGTGPSGMGNYHGWEGFLTFSHAKGVYRQTGSEIIKMLRPPYGAAIRKEIRKRLTK
ncbi:coniferyl aldehyde dehydrogenase [Paracoccus sp. PAR01]|uniref:coniferyl aldehyde dehydrogenase n=1 Tax=Paracoccus sp. PAR01 TaxID=2769282 RepID=UPI00178040B7|nr:coniferyl aldehyde dehydrogenase [Paracoccus sp. PAR01]MBD9528332.1 coniferyl aldehyde dehydrogenase [Paracoccus sp. PAR01]